MVWKPVRLICYMFLLPFLDLTVHHVQQPCSQGFLSCSEKEKYETAN